MLDTKLKNMRRIKDCIIVCCALIPALVLVALYPKMEAAMLKYQAELEKEIEDTNAQNEYSYYLEDNFINYAVEASYYIYGQLYQEKLGSALDFSVLKKYGWVNDYYRINSDTYYYAELFADATKTEVVTKKNTEIDLSNLLHEGDKHLLNQYQDYGIKGFMALEYDGYGQLSDIRYAFADGVELYEQDMYWRASESVEKYLNNADFYVTQKLDGAAGTAYENQTYHGTASDMENLQDQIDIGESTVESGIYNEVPGGTETPVTREGGASSQTGNVSTQKSMELEKYLQVCPRNFSIVFALPECDFLHQNYIGDYYYGWNATSAYLATGTYWIVIALAAAVALMALILPFFKKLQTGWEKLFCMPFEIICFLIGGGFAAATGMFVAMSHTTMKEMEMIAVEQPVNFMGSNLSAGTLYGILIVLNFLAWALLFFAEYVVIASLRQFFCGSKEYLKNRLLIVKIWHWLKKQLRRLHEYVMDIDINDKLIISILKIVGVNFGILTILCCLWFFGIVGLLIYSIVLFIVMRKYGEKLQQQFKSLLNATNQMAQGDLKITMEKNLGLFQPLGDELEKVQQGFAKAVAEEAKSQNMKTELITNVSHDLKTPLTAIITYVDLLKKEGITDEERDSYIATIDQKSQRLKVLIEDLFEVSKANSGNIQMHFMDVDVVNLMKQVRLEMEEKIADSDLNFRWNLPEKHVMLSLDGQRTYRIFENLLNNILKYSLPYTRVYIDILEQGDEVYIVFRNISAVELEGDGQNLTDRFVRGDASRNTEGSGLGLAIVKSFVELQNGKLNIDVDGDLFKVTIIWNRI